MAGSLFLFFLLGYICWNNSCYCDDVISIFCVKYFIFYKQTFGAARDAVQRVAHYFLPEPGFRFAPTRLILQQWPPRSTVAINSSRSHPAQRAKLGSFLISSRHTEAETPPPGCFPLILSAPCGPFILLCSCVSSNLCKHFSSRLFWVINPNKSRTVCVWLVNFTLIVRWWVNNRKTIIPVCNLICFSCPLWALHLHHTLKEHV